MLFDMDGLLLDTEVSTPCCGLLYLFPSILLTGCIFQRFYTLAQVCTIGRTRAWATLAHWPLPLSDCTAPNSQLLMQEQICARYNRKFSWDLKVRA